MDKLPAVTPIYDLVTPEIEFRVTTAQNLLGHAIDGDIAYGDAIDAAVELLTVAMEWVEDPEGMQERAAAKLAQR